jgi:LPS sulfotransferase NodH
MFFIPSYEAWLRSRDASLAYEFHQRFLKHLQWLCPAERWVLKSSDHVHNLKTLIQRYPEARIIFLHRDPIKVLQAASSQQTLLKSVFSRRINPRLLGAYEDRSLYDKVHKIMEFRDSHIYMEDRFMDVRYLELSSDPVGIVRAIYDRFGLALSVEAEASMQAFAAAERDKRRSDRFLLADFGLDPEQEYPPFDRYCARFHVAREVL